MSEGTVGAEELGLAYEAIDAGGALVWSTRRNTAR
jgi:hypothetical protein